MNRKWKGTGEAWPSLSLGPDVVVWSPTENLIWLQCELENPNSHPCPNGPMRLKYGERNFRGKAFEVLEFLRKTSIATGITCRIEYDRKGHRFSGRIGEEVVFSYDTKKPIPTVLVYMLKIAARRLGIPREDQDRMLKQFEKPSESKPVPPAAETPAIASEVTAEPSSVSVPATGEAESVVTDEPSAEAQELPTLEDTPEAAEKKISRLSRSTKKK